MLHSFRRFATTSVAVISTVSQRAYDLRQLRQLIRSSDDAGYGVPKLGR